MIDRVSADDLMSLVAERGSLPLQVGAILRLDTSSGVSPARVLETIGRRLPNVPRFRQRLVSLPLGCGRPVWVDHGGFQLAEHLSVVGAAGDDEAALRVAAELLTVPLPRDRPLWTARLVTGPDPAGMELVLVFHHVLADGVAGLALLAGLVDGASDGPPDGASGFPQPGPSPTAAAQEAFVARLRGVRRLPAAARRLASAFGELGPSMRRKADPCSLNRATGTRRRLLTVRCELATVRAVGHAHGATVNDVLLAVIARSLHALLSGRGEQVPVFTLSVPLSARTAAGSAELGNQSGAIPLPIPATGTFADQLAAVARSTATAKRSSRGATTAVLGPLFRLLALVGLYQRFINRQRIIHTFVSNVKGPPARLALAGCPITDLIPLSFATGNVTVSFTVLSYDDQLTVTVVADPDACPDLAELERALRSELDRLP